MTPEFDFDNRLKHTHTLTHTYKCVYCRQSQMRIQLKLSEVNSWSKRKRERPEKSLKQSEQKL